ncbi:MAG: carboxypeptidase-like regulatory domain-containing protein, partial [Gillisia sp.]
ALTFIPGSAFAFFQQSNQHTTDFNEYKGKVVDDASGDAIASAFLMVNGTNISTITNADGEFSLKIPSDLTDLTITTTFLGYKSKTLPLSYFQKEGTKIALVASVEELPEISLMNPGDARELIRIMLDRKGDNYFNDQTLMTAFYRETIKKGHRDVSLSEAVLKIHKQPYNSGKSDDIAIYKARKSTDYDKLDTLALKLRGGPFNTLYVDVMKYPEFLFDDNALEDFDFSFDKTTKINDQYIYMIDFEERDHNRPWYYGKLYVDTQSLTLIKADYNLNVDNRDKASKMFVKKKPSGARVYPIDVNYQIDYRESNGKWYYGYGNAELEFVVNWKHKLFNSRYTLSSEMAVTDWEKYTGGISKNDKIIHPSVVMIDDVSGFSDANFWGRNNIIEPEKSIQNAIKKIQRKIDRQ